MTMTERVRKEKTWRMGNEKKADGKIRGSCIHTYRPRAPTLSTNFSFLNSGIQCTLKDALVVTSLKSALI